MEILVNQIEKRSWVEINTSQLRRNYLIYKNILKREVNIMAVIKADAYGHGDVQVARILMDAGVTMFAVSNIDEAIGLREAGISCNILLLGYTSPVYAKTIYDYDLTQAIVSEEYASILAKCNFNIKCHFAIDTGMNRIGLNALDIDYCEKIIREYSNHLKIEGIFTHLCVADILDKQSKLYTQRQISLFNKLSNRLKDLNFPYIHCLNSAGGMHYLNNILYNDNIGKLVRLGIILYGLKPDSNCILPKGIAPVLSWYSSVSMVKYVYPGETIGYGRTFCVEKKMIVATVTTGYADGLNRLLSNRGFVLIKGKKAPIVGRICMDQTMVDVTDIPGVKMGDKVVILGKSGNIKYDADDMANDLGTISYEILCNISKRVQRFYVNSNNNL